MKAQQIKWSNELIKPGLDILSKPGGAIVSPTKVGYIIMTTDRIGLERKFAAKNRNLNKPGVVLLSSINQLTELAELNDEIIQFYQRHWEQNILLGCILPWQAAAQSKYIPNDQSAELIMDQRKTSCFVIKYGLPSEQIVTALWNSEQKLTFASSANPSGQGNRGVITGVGTKIMNEVDLLIEADEYVHSNQPDQDSTTRYEQGVMISMVDQQGKLIPVQGQERMVTPCPVLIRKGLAVDQIMNNLTEQFNSWDYRHGQYY
ncbi:MAG: Sua5/YciO/YrdC/YwlC family protein [bacterium]